MGVAAAGCARWPAPGHISPSPASTLTVGPGKRYSTIQAAVDAAKPGDTVTIFPGTYGRVSAFGKKIHLVGTDRDRCIILDSSADYYTPPVEIGAGSVRNLTIIEDHFKPTAATKADSFAWERAYSIHVEDYTTCYDKHDQTLIDNCVVRNTKRAALGMGLYRSHTIIVSNCDIWSGKPDRTPDKSGDFNRGAVYFHNQKTNHPTDDQHLKLLNNKIHCDDKISLWIGDTFAASGFPATMDVLAQGNTCTPVATGGVGFNRHVTLAPGSHGNTAPALNA